MPDMIPTCMLCMPCLEKTSNFFLLSVLPLDCEDSCIFIMECPTQCHYKLRCAHLDWPSLSVLTMTNPVDMEVH